ncbi:hypothetical protein NP493_8956g00004, partial [Ridgeia piscesae]
MLLWRSTPGNMENRGWFFGRSGDPGGEVPLIPDGVLLKDGTCWVVEGPLSPITLTSMTPTIASALSITLRLSATGARRTGLPRRAPESGTCVQTSGTKRAGSAGARSALKTLSGGEFDWGGTSVKRAAASLRSIETKPFDSGICPLLTDPSSTTNGSQLSRPAGRPPRAPSQAGRQTGKKNGPERRGRRVRCGPRPAAGRRVGEPAASAERERGRQRRCLRLLTYKFFRSGGISFVYGGSELFRRPRKYTSSFIYGVRLVYGGSVSSTGISCFRKVAQEKRAGPARPSGEMRPGRPPGAGSVSRRRRPNARDGGGSADVCVYLLTSSFCLRGISFVYGGSDVSPTKKIHKFVLSTGDQFRLRGSVVRLRGSVVFERLRRKNSDRRGRRVRCARWPPRRRVGELVAQEKRAGPARPSGAMRPAARRRVGEPAASAERERRGRQRRCLRLLTYDKFFLSTGISFVYGGSVVSLTKKIHKFILSTGDQFRLRGISCFRKVAQEKRAGPARPSGAMRPGRRRRVGEPAASAERERRGRQRRCLRLLTYKFFLSTGDQFRLRGISCFADQENTQVRFVYGGSVSSTGDQFRLRGSVVFERLLGRQEKRAGPARPSGAAEPRRGRQRRCLRLLLDKFFLSTGDQFRLRGISCFADQENTQVRFVYGGSVSSTGDQFRLRGISCFRKVAQEKRAGPARPSGAMRPGRPPGAGSVSRRRRPNARDGGGSADVCVYLLTRKTGRTGAAVGCDAARPAARRRVGEPNARDGGGSADVCVYLLTSSFCLRGISFVYGGSVVSPTKKIHKFVLSTGDQFRLRGISFVYGGSVVFERLRGKNGSDRSGRRVRCGPAGCSGAGRREPAASAERERRGRQRRCLRLLTYKFFLSTGDQFRLRGISCFTDQENTQVHFVYGGSVSSTGDQLFSKGCAGKRAGPARPSGAMRPGRPPGAGSVSAGGVGRTRETGEAAPTFATTYLLTTGDQLRLRGSVVSPTKKIHKFVLSTGDQFRLRGISFVYGDQLFSKGCLDGRKNGPDRRGRRVRC